MISKAKPSASSSAPAPAAVSISMRGWWRSFSANTCPASRRLSPQNMPGGSSVVAANYLLHDGQTRWPDAGRLARRSVFRSGAGPRHGEVRLGEIYLDRFAGTARSAALHARGQPVQDPRRYPARRRAAAVRRRGNRSDGLLRAENLGRNSRPQIQNGYRLSKRRRDRYRRGARRAALPGVRHRQLRRPRPDANLVQKRLCEKSDSNRQEARCPARRRADAV